MLSTEIGQNDKHKIFHWKIAHYILQESVQLTLKISINYYRSYNKNNLFERIEKKKSFLNKNRLEILKNVMKEFHYLSKLNTENIFGFISKKLTTKVSNLF